MFYHFSKHTFIVNQLQLKSKVASWIKSTGIHLIIHFLNTDKFSSHLFLRPLSLNHYRFTGFLL